MPQLDIKTKTRVVMLRHHEYSVSAIKRPLLAEYISVSTADIHSSLKKNKLHNSIIDCPRKCFAKKLDKEKLYFINESMAANNEVTARELWLMLQKRWPDPRVSLTTIKQACKDDL